MFKHWAQPVTSVRWAIVTIVLDAIKRASGYRILAAPAHLAWARATR